MLHFVSFDRLPDEAKRKIKYVLFCYLSKHVRNIYIYNLFVYTEIILLELLVCKKPLSTIINAKREKLNLPVGLMMQLTVAPKIDPKMSA